MKMRFWIAVALLIGSAHAETMPLYSCTGSDKWACEMGSGCKSIGASTITARFDFSKPAYARCDNKGCDTYTPVVTSSGEFLVIELSGRGTFAKIGPNGSFTEVTSLATIVAVTYGFCKAE
jgi:hypothetical protein